MARFFSFSLPFRKAGGLQIPCCQGIAVADYSFTLDALALKPSSFCNVGVEFAESIKSDMGSMARGRTIRGVKDGFEPRESQSGYNADFDPKNCDIAAEKA